MAVERSRLEALGFKAVTMTMVEVALGVAPPIVRESDVRARQHLSASAFRCASTATVALCLSRHFVCWSLLTNVLADDGRGDPPTGDGDEGAGERRHRGEQDAHTRRARWWGRQRRGRGGRGVGGWLFATLPPCSAHAPPCSHFGRRPAPRGMTRVTHTRCRRRWAWLSGAGRCVSPASPDVWTPPPSPAPSA